MGSGDVCPGGPAPFAAITELCPDGLLLAPAGCGFQKLPSDIVKVLLLISHSEEGQASGEVGYGNCDEQTLNTLECPTHCDHIDVSLRALLSHSRSLQTLFSLFPAVCWSGATPFPQPGATLSAQGRGLPLRLNVRCATRYCDFPDCVSVFLIRLVLVRNTGSGLLMALPPGPRTPCHLTHSKGSEHRFASVRPNVKWKRMWTKALDPD